MSCINWIYIHIQARDCTHKHDNSISNLVVEVACLGLDSQLTHVHLIVIIGLLRYLWVDAHLVTRSQYCHLDVKMSFGINVQKNCNILIVLYTVTVTVWEAVCLIKRDEISNEPNPKKEKKQRKDDNIKYSNTWPMKDLTENTSTFPDSSHSSLELTEFKTTTYSWFSCSTDLEIAIGSSL